MLRTNVLVLALALTFSGCVGQKKYDELESLYTDLQGRTAALEKERDGLMGDRAQLGASLAEMEKALEGLKAREAAAQARVAEFKDMLERFQKLIDAGTLKVKMVDGRMVVELATDVLFGSGSADLSATGKEAINEVSNVLTSIPDRNYQVEGHTDDVPIATAQYPSNWVLASARALTVVQTMIKSGLPSQRVSAASFGDTRPVEDNGTKEGRAGNRRIEIVILPDLSGLPGFEELQAVSQ